MKALVTGGAGFVGRHMVAELLTRGYDVTSVDLNAMEVSYNFPGPVHLHIIQDVNDFVRRSHPPMWGQFDLVVHCAYHVGGRAAIDGVNLNFMRNVQLDAAMFEWAIQTKQKQFLYFSSSAVYPHLVQGERYAGRRLEEYERTFDDADEWGVTGYAWTPDALYGWAKLLGEKMAMNAREQGMKVSVVRPFSGYGEDQDLNYPFPSFAQRAKNRENPFTIWGSVDQTRDWIHIDDVVKGALAVVEHGTTQPVNLCTGRAMSMYDLVTQMASYVGYVPTIIGDDSKPHGVMHRVGDPSLFYTIYMPSVPIEEGVRRALKEV